MVFHSLFICDMQIFSSPCGCSVILDGIKVNFRAEREAFCGDTQILQLATVLEVSKKVSVVLTEDVENVRFGSLQFSMKDFLKV